MLFVIVGLASCESYDDYDSPGIPVIGFDQNGSNITVPGGGTVDELGVRVFVSDVSSIERTFNVVVVEDESTVSADNYSFNAAVQIPANEREGTFSFTAIDNSLTTEADTLVFAFDHSNSAYISGRRISYTLKTN